MAELTFYSDIVCPWATVMVLRLLEARDRAGAQDNLIIRHRALPLELEHGRPIPRRIVDAEIPLCATLAPQFGWSVWQGRCEEYPVTVLAALEAVQAAAAQSPLAAEQLDLALRRAFFVHSRCIAMRHEIVAAARTCEAVDAERIAAALDAGTYRHLVTADFLQAKVDRVPCSGTLVRADGTMLCNPATEIAWIGGDLPRGTPTVVVDDPTVFDRIVAEAVMPVSRGDHEISPDGSGQSVKVRTVISAASYPSGTSPVSARVAAIRPWASDAIAE
jgi:predicted DsbA family dithiol-disulfide isomerase